MSEQLPVELVVRAHHREPSVLRGWISRKDYRALSDGSAPVVVRVNDCQSELGLFDPPEDIYVRSAYILSIELLEQAALFQSAMPR